MMDRLSSDGRRNRLVDERNLPVPFLIVLQQKRHGKNRPTLYPIRNYYCSLKMLQTS